MIGIRKRNNHQEKGVVSLPKVNNQVKLQDANHQTMRKPYNKVLLEETASLLLKDG
jgi:hypothetical protein